jgi:hypothetical protein
MVRGPVNLVVMRERERERKERSRVDVRTLL